MLLTGALLLTSWLAAPAENPQPRSGWHAAPGYEHVVPRLHRDSGHVFSNLRYEGNNRGLRGAFDWAADRVAKRCADAERTRALAARTDGLFVLRDALFSQQDHPVDQASCALMMPSNWISGAVDDALHGRKGRGLVAPDVTDDLAWAALSTPEQMFGSFQASATLHRWAVRRPGEANRDDRARIVNAREAVRTLASHADALLAAGTARAAAQVGAEIIAQSDRDYFGADVRRDWVIPIFVEKPSPHEIEHENKGLEIHARTLDPEAIRLTREVVYRRRLQDGQLAIERYDITNPAELAHLVQVLEMLVPAGGPKGHKVHVWVGGPLIKGTERVEDVHGRMPELTAALDAAKIDRARVVVFARPVFQSKGRTRAELEAGILRARDQGVLYGVNMSGLALRRKLGWKG